MQIIPKIVQPVERSWQKELANGISDPRTLLQHLGLPSADADKDIAARQLFPMRVPLPFVQRMKKGDPQDPLFLQVMTQQQEFDEVSGFVTDPLAEQDNATPGILHKYQSRALLIVRGGCAINCRYCFRRHFPYGDNHLNKAQWQQALAHIRADAKINEVIFSGGDPLMANDEFLSWLIQQVEDIRHVRRLRIHTRLPVVIPARVTHALVNSLSDSRLKAVIVLHINHANEIDSSLAEKLTLLTKAGITLLNQSVLLHKINNSADALEDLSERLFEVGVMPYYLHLLDKVAGAHHFDVTEQDAREIMVELIGRLPGFLVPRLVREIAGQPGKTPIDLRLSP